VSETVSSEIAQYFEGIKIPEDYETKHWPLDALDPVEAIRYRMEQSDLKAKDLFR
jgi:HTH-type transcriptional regulator/antitoxin HigA